MLRAVLLLLPLAFTFAAEEMIRLSDGREVRGEVQADGSVIVAYGAVRAPLNLKGATITGRRAAEEEPERTTNEPAKLSKTSGVSPKQEWEALNAKKLELQAQINKIDSDLYEIGQRRNAAFILNFDTTRFKIGEIRPYLDPKLSAKEKEEAIFFNQKREAQEEYNQTMDYFDDLKKQIKAGTLRQIPDAAQNSIGKIAHLYSELHGKKLKE